MHIDVAFFLICGSLFLGWIIHRTFIRKDVHLFKEEIQATGFFLMAAFLIYWLILR